MTQTEKLALLKTDLGLLTVDEAVGDYLAHCLGSAESFIAREGITLEDTVEDTQLVVMYAAYLYRKRAVGQGTQNTGAMPRMLRYALNCRLFSQKAGGAE